MLKQFSLIFSLSSLMLLLVIISCHQKAKEEKKAIVEAEKSSGISSDSSMAIHHIHDTISTSASTSDKASQKVSTADKTKKTIEKISALYESVSQDTYTNSTIPGSVQHTFSERNGKIYFKRNLKNAQDQRVGGSGGSSILTFTIETSKDSFQIENELLSAIELHYSVVGEIYEAKCVNPKKGKIKGTKLANGNWNIELKVWFNMMDALNNTFLKELNFIQVFTP